MTEKNANAKIRLLTLAGAMTALTVIFTAYIFHIPVGINGGYVHFGDTVIYLAAVLLPAPYAMMVGALGGGIADLLTAPMWAIATVIIKMLIVIPFTSKGDSLLTKRNLAAPIISFFISATGYFIAEKIIFGGEVASHRRQDGNAATGEAFGKVVIAFTLQLEAHAMHEEGSEGLSGRTFELHLHGIVSQSRTAIALGDSS